MKCKHPEFVDFYSFSDTLLDNRAVKYVDEWRVELNAHYGVGTIDVTPKFMLRINAASGEGILHLCRTDNRTKSEDPPLEVYAIDSLWTEHLGGWSDPLTLILRGKGKAEVCLELPRNPADHDCVKIYASSINAKAVEKPSSEIPRQIFQSTRTALLPCLKKSTSSFRSLNPAWNYKLLIDDQGGLQEKEQMIQDMEGPRAAEAFRKIQPGAFKTDLWRYVVMYHHGGVYADDKLLLLYPLDTIIKPGMRALLVRDTPGNGIYNAFIAIVPKHPLMLLAIKKAVENIEKNFYGSNTLEITGPRHLGKCLEECGSECQQGLYFLDFTKPGDLIVDRGRPTTEGDSLTLILAHNIEYRRFTHQLDIRNNYHTMWHEGRVYIDEAQLKTTSDRMKDRIENKTGKTRDALFRLESSSSDNTSLVIFAISTGGIIAAALVFYLIKMVLKFHWQRSEDLVHEDPEIQHYHQK